MALSVVLCCLVPSGLTAQERASGRVLQHPAAWGDIHVGEDLPPYEDGSECLFCHRADIAASWKSDPHRQSVRDLDPDSPLVRSVVGPFVAAAGQAFEITAVVGSKSVLRFLRPNGNRGRFSLFQSALEGRPGSERRLTRTEGAAWDDDKYARRCAGCHSSAVDTKSWTFAAPSLDCYSCHGEVSSGHVSDVSLVLLSKERQSARQVTSVCGSCHIRSGVSATTGSPFANQFVAGDNLFRDLQVDLSDAALAVLNPGDRHILENVRQVVQRGDPRVSCLSCHRVHSPSTRAHQDLPREPPCLTCHESSEPHWRVEEYEVSSAVCEYGTEWEVAEQHRLEEEERLRLIEQERSLEALTKFLSQPSLSTTDPDPELAAPKDEASETAKEPL